MNYSNSDDHLLGGIIILLISALIAATMLLGALLLYLAELLGSFTGSLLIIGGVAALIACVIYFASVRPRISQMRREIETLLEVAKVARSGYSWVMQQIAALLGIK